MELASHKECGGVGMRRQLTMIQKILVQSCSEHTEVMADEDGCRVMTDVER